jgi:1-acyl-sn-glycerol-3-phosphate acyltransferase
VKQKVIYDNRFWSGLFYAVSWCFLKLSGWKVVGEIPAQKKLVIIGAPHTSNWDFPVLMALVGFKRLRVSYLGKHSLFKNPQGRFFYYLGGIPVNRKSPDAKDIVEQVVGEFNERDHVWLGVAPEGTRTKVDKWKTGFYRIAAAAGVPIAPVFIDGKNKKMGFGPVMQLSEDMQDDIAKLQAFYAPIKGIKPQNQ